MRALVLVVFWGLALALPPPFDRLEAALGARDLAALSRLVSEESYAAVVAAKALAEAKELSPESRAEYARFVLAEEKGERLWAAGVLAELGYLDEAARLYRAELKKEEAVRGLLTLAERGSEEAVRGLLAAGYYKEALAYAKGERERGLALLGLGRAREALALLYDYPAERARALLALGEKEEAARAFLAAHRYYQAAEVYAGLGEKGRAVSLFLKSGERGLWQAARLLEGEDKKRALSLYSRLAKTEGRLADDAAFRAYVLAERLGDEGAKREAEARLKGGFALLLGKKGPTLRLPPLPGPPRGLDELAELAERRPEWARGEARYRARRAAGEERRALAWVLFALGDYHHAARYGGLRLRYATPYREEVMAAAREFGLDPWVIYAVMRVESAFDERAVSPTGAKGLMQFVGPTWKDLSRRLGVKASPFEPEASIRLGAYYLAWLRDYFDGNLPLALTAYNGGPGYVRREYQRHPDLYDFIVLQRRDEPREYLAKVWYDLAVYHALASVRGGEPEFLKGFPRRR